MQVGPRFLGSRCPGWAVMWPVAWLTPVRGRVVAFWAQLGFCCSPERTLCYCLMYYFLLDYHKAAMGLGAQGLILSRDNEDQVVKVLRDGQKLCQEGHAVVVNILIGRTDFRDGSISV